VVPGRRSVEQDRALTAELHSVARGEAGIGGEVALFLLSSSPLVCSLAGPPPVQ
jgi:hypothetical protein